MDKSNVWLTGAGGNPYNINVTPWVLLALHQDGLAGYIQMQIYSLSVNKYIKFNFFPPYIQHKLTLITLAAHVPVQASQEPQGSVE
jgi:hypothetical protein